MNVRTGVFKDIRVLDIGHVVAGPFIASVLADFGADVIKVERPRHGDPLRQIYCKDGVGLWSKVQGRNKRSITIDLKHPQGKQLFRRLVEQSDVLVENFRPGVMERLGFGWEELSAINPRLVLCRLSGFGQTGPYAERRAYGRVGEAFAGFAHLTGDPAGPPSHSHMSVGDTVAGAWAAMGVMMALYWRDAQGGGLGQVVDVGLYEGLFRQIEQQIIVLDQLGVNMQRSGSNHRNVPYTGLFKTRDGRYFSFSAVTEKSAGDVLKSMGLENDDRFNTFARCMAHRDLFAETVEGWMAAHDGDEIEALFVANTAPGTIVKGAADLINDPHVLARQMVITLPDQELGPVRMTGVLPKLSRTPGEIRHTGQMLGQSNKEVFREMLGLSDSEIDDLEQKGVV
jgi:formyl-CoA transferase